MRYVGSIQKRRRAQAIGGAFGQFARGLSLFCICAYAAGVAVIGFGGGALV